MKIGGVSAPIIERSTLFEPLEKLNDSNAKTFGEMLSSALGEVNTLQKVSAQKNIDMVAGKIEDISEVMIAAEKAAISLQLTNQVRNKVVEAYQEMMRMSI